MRIGKVMQQATREGPGDDEGRGRATGCEAGCVVECDMEQHAVYLGAGKETEPEATIHRWTAQMMPIHTVCSWHVL